MPSPALGCDGTYRVPQTTVRREGALEASEDFLKQVELFLDTAVRDVKDSLVRYDSTRRASSAAIETLAASRSAQQVCPPAPSRCVFLGCAHRRASQGKRSGS